MNRTGLTPDLLLAPGWSQKPAIAALLAVKAGSVNTLLRAKALVDIDSTATGVTDPGDLLEYKTKNSLTDPALLMHWPMVTFAGKKFHLSTHLAALMAQVDGENGGVPYASPAGNSLKIDGCCLADGTEVSLTFDQVNRIAGHQGIVTALYFGLSGQARKVKCQLLKLFPVPGKGLLELVGIHCQPGRGFGRFLFLGRLLGGFFQLCVLLHGIFGGCHK